MSDEVEAPKAATLATWKKSAVHTVICPSGSYVTLKIPDLPRMIEAGQIPQHLLEAALGAAGAGDDITAKSAEDRINLIKQQREFTDHIVMMAVIEPKITEADLLHIPYEDMEFITQVASRARDLDAVGDHIAGLHKNEAFRRFRRIGEFSEDVEGL
jgi:hypothetical protein